VNNKTIEKIERLNLLFIGLGTLISWGLHLGHVPSFLIGGLLMQVNFWLLKKIVSLLLFRTGDGQHQRRGAIFVIVSKGLIFLLLLSALFIRYPIEPLSFMAGVSLLVMTCMIVSLLDSKNGSRVATAEK